jgi:hypothetical protein
VNADGHENPGSGAAITAPASGTATPQVRALTPTERVLVPFVGKGAGRGELSWGQREIWSAMQRQGWLCIGGVIPLPAGKTMPEVVDELSVLIGYFPSMRTRLRFDAAGRPSQELFGSGELMIEVFDTDFTTATATDPDPDATADSAPDTHAHAPEALSAQIEARYRAMPRDFEEEWPQRVGVVRAHGRLTHLIVVTCHLVTDLFGVEAMNRQLAAGLSGQAAGMQQLEQAAWQSSVAGRRQSDASLRYWERMLRSIPRRPLPTSPDPREPRHWTGQLRSSALRAALPMIAERTGTDGSSVLMTLYALALGEMTGDNPVAIWTLVNNRFRPGLADVVCNLVQSGICILDVEGVAFDDLTRRTWRAAINAYKHAYYDSELHAAMIGRLAPDQGPATGVPYFFNDRRSEVARAAADVPMTPELLRELAQRSTFSWIGKKDNPFERMFLNVEDDPEVVEMTVQVDTHFFSPAQIETLLRRMEAVAITQALA